jgi:hypothetical protein
MTAMVTGMFIFAGYQHTLIAIEGEDEQRAERIKLALGGGGELEVAIALQHLAFSAERVANRIYDELVPDAPGIWEYEVAEELGSWLVAFADEHDHLPSDMEWEDEVELRTRKFINQCETIGA